MMADDSHLSLVVGENKRKNRLDIDEEMIRKIEIIAYKNGKTIEDFVSEAVEKCLALDEEKI